MTMGKPRTEAQDVALYRRLHALKEAARLGDGMGSAKYKTATARLRQAERMMPWAHVEAAKASIRADFKAQFEQLRAQHERIMAAHPQAPPSAPRPRARKKTLWEIEQAAAKKRPGGTREQRARAEIDAEERRLFGKVSKW